MSHPKLQNAIFISGAGQRIGAYLARYFIEKTDFPVVFTYRTKHADVDQLIELGAVAIQCDFLAEKALPNLLKQLSSQVESLRAVIHNASLWLDDVQAPVGSEAYQAMFKVHVDTPMYLNRALYPFLMQSDSALKDIISISDDSVDRANDSTIGYLASKAALQNLSKHFAKKYAPDIKVNDIAPGLIKFNLSDSDDYKKRRLSQSAIPVEPGEVVIASAVEYLMQSPYTTGSCVQLNGGRHLINSN